MDWVKLTTNYYLDAAIMRAGEASEVLFTRALAYVGDQETEGVVHREVLPRLTPTRGAARAAALVREGLWEVVPEGWRFTGWEKHQTTVEQLQAKRDAGRARQARHRDRRNGMRNAVTNASVTETEGEGEVDAAAAAGNNAAAAADLDGRIAVLADKLRAHTPLRGIRFDTLRPDQAAQVVGLIEAHGDDPLVAVAISTCRHPAPTHASAFLGTWAALPPPGRPLAVVRQRLCDTHGTVLTASGTCSSCHADQKAAR